MITAFQRGVVTTDHGLEWRRPDSRGYGTVSWTVGGRTLQTRAHRIAWMLENGPIPDGYDIDHLPSCPKTCVTVEHLQLLSKSDHTKLGWERGELNGRWGTARERIHPPKAKSFSWQTERQCKNCNQEFLPRTARQLHCSSECSTKFKEALRAPRRYPRPSVRECSWCKTEFAPKRVDSIFCSRKCIDDDQNDKKRWKKLGGEE